MYREKKGLELQAALFLPGVQGCSAVSQSSRGVLTSLSIKIAWKVRFSACSPDSTALEDWTAPFVNRSESLVTSQTPQTLRKLDASYGNVMLPVGQQKLTVRQTWQLRASLHLQCHRSEHRRSAQIVVLALSVFGACGYCVSVFLGAFT